MSDEDTMVSTDENRPEAGGTGEGQNERLVPVGEAIRYRKRAQAAEKELSELKELHDAQGKELEQLKEQLGKFNTPSLQPPPPSGVLPLDRGRANNVLQGESFSGVMTQGVKETRTGGARNRLEAVATRAAESGKRADVQEYLRVRRAYV